VGTRGARTPSPVPSTAAVLPLDESSQRGHGERGEGAAKASGDGGGGGDAAVLAVEWGVVRRTVGTVGLFHRKRAAWDPDVCDLYSTHCHVVHEPISVLGMILHCMAFCRAEEAIFSV
jgi:hypothetical protein